MRRERRAASRVGRSGGGCVSSVIGFLHEEGHKGWKGMCLLTIGCELLHERCLLDVGGHLGGVVCCLEGTDKATKFHG